MQLERHCVVSSTATCVLQACWAGYVMRQQVARVCIKGPCHDPLCQQIAKAQPRQLLDPLTASMPEYAAELYVGKTAEQARQLGRQGTWAGKASEQASN